MHRARESGKHGAPARARWVEASLLAAILPIAAAPGIAAERPRIYALTHATVIPAPGQSIESATVVIRDGLIEAVGAGVAIPADAVEIDASERWIYPGLIDLDSDLGIKADSPASGAPRGPSFGPPRSDTPAGAVHPLQRIRAEARTRDRLLPFSDDRQREMERVREHGMTVVLATPGSGILRGSSTAILLCDERPVSELILRDNVAQHAAFERGRFGQGYPTSLMGSVAALRQAFLDGGRYATWAERYARNPSGMNRPEFHATSEALRPVLTGRQPIVFHTENAQDSLLADRLGREFDLRVLLAASGQEWEVAERIAAAGRPMILPVAFPDKPKVDDEDEALELSRRELRRYVEAPKAPLRLHEAGTRFAFTLRDLKNIADFPKNMRKILEAGLPEHVALAAWTTHPAEMIGLDRVVGTLEPGKIANLIVADGPLFGEETVLQHVFVDGIQYEIETKEKPKGDPDAVVDPRGAWSVAFDFGSRTMQREWTIGGEKDSYEGTAETQGGTVTFDSVELAGNAMTVVFPARGDRGSMEITVIVEGDSFEGVAEMGPRSVVVKGTRTAGPDGGVR